jgi:ubiquitin C-terminal hydrolase
MSFELTVVGLFVFIVFGLTFIKSGLKNQRNGCFFSSVVTHIFSAEDMNYYLFRNFFNHFIKYSFWWHVSDFFNSRFVVKFLPAIVNGGWS